MTPTGWLIFFVLLLGLALFLATASLREQASARTAGPRSVIRNARAPPDWISAEVQRIISGDLATGAGEAWRSDAITDRQLNRLARHGIKFRNDLPTKGQASDLIGLFEKPSDNDKKVLRYFKATPEHPTQTHARARITELLADPANRAAWDNRRAEPLTRAQAAFYGLPLTRDTTETNARTAIAAFENDDTNAALTDDWAICVEILDTLRDPDEAAAWDCRRPTETQALAAILALRDEGRSLRSIEGDLDLCFERLTALYPQIRTNKR